MNLSKVTRSTTGWGGGAGFVDRGMDSRDGSPTKNWRDNRDGYPTKERNNADGYRTGLTLVELMVALAITSMLMALLLPAVMQARASARRTQCANNLRNISLAMLASVTAANRFPPSGYYDIDKHNTPFPTGSWVVPLLARLERADIAQKWDREKPPYDKNNKRLTELHLAVLACPDDISVVGDGDLSYVVNGGVGYTIRDGKIDDCPVTIHGKIDLNGNGVTCPPLTSKKDGGPADRSLLTMLGLFFVESGGKTGTTRHHTRDSVLDGLSQTFMLSENVRAGYDPAVAGKNWASPDPTRTSFYFSDAVCKSRKCSKHNVDYSRANSAMEGINASLTQAEGEAPWPSSFHVDGAHFVFADGHLRFISQSLDGAVYASLFSPQGERLEPTALKQAIVDETKIE